MNLSEKEKRDIYREFSVTREDISLFSQAWWLDIVCGEDGWNVCLVMADGKVIASMPYFLKHAKGFKRLVQPPLTKSLGPWILPSNAKYAKRLSKEKDIMEKLIAQLPEYHFFNQNWHYSLQNWLPFYWAGFSQTTRYTYIIDDLKNLDKVWDGFQANIRTDIRKATDKFNLTIKDDLPVEVFIELNKLTFKRQGLALPYSEQFVKNLHRKTSVQKRSKTFIAVDTKGRPHAGIFIVWDKDSTYYLMSGGDPELRNSGATSMLLWHAIQFAATVSEKFDFEGSMIEPVERFCRAFGARQQTYFSVSHAPSRLFNTLIAVKGMLK